MAYKILSYIETVSRPVLVDRSAPKGVVVVPRGAISCIGGPFVFLKNQRFITLNINMKKILSYTLFSLLFFISIPFIAHASDSQSITLNPGWNVISVPNLVNSHSFSSPDKNFDIKLLESGKWKSMGQLNQSEFRPLFGYFIKNKTKSNQTLTLNYKGNVSADEANFSRQMGDGINVIGIANPQYALKQADPNSGKDNANSILGDTNKCVIALFDFTYTNPDDSSVKISQGWLLKNLFSFKKIKDLKETKAYGVWLKKDCEYKGYQEPTVPVIQIGSLAVSKDATYQDINVVPNTTNAKIGQYVFTAGPNEDLIVDSLNLNFLSGYNQISNIRLISGGVTLNSISQLSTSSAVYSPLFLNIPKNQTKDITVYADINPNASGTIQTQIVSPYDVIAKGSNYGTVVNISGTPAIGQTVSIINSKITAFQNSVNNSLIPAGVSGINLATVFFQAKDGSFKIDNLAFKSATPATSLENIRLISNNTVIAYGRIDQNNEIKFSDINFVIPNGTVANLRLIADISSVNFISGESFRFDLDPAGFAAQEMATGNAVPSYESSNPIIGNKIVVRKSVPHVTTLQPLGILVNGDNNLIRFSVVADVVGPISWKKIALNSQISDGLSLSNFQLYDADTQISADITTQSNGDIVIELPQEEYVNAGIAKTYFLKSTVSGVTSGSSISTYIKGSNDAIVKTSAYDPNLDNFIWSDLLVVDHSLISSDWCNAIYINELPSIIATISN